ncbi:MAG: hypothetical protein E7345_02545 [Clostridiales bacterium]|nr:hypothetical protein [Clostridiales bacterium]
MNIVWSGVMLVGIGLLAINNVDLAMECMFAGSSKAISLAFKLWGIYTLWLGILKIVEDTGLDKKLAKLFSPLIKLLFGKTDDYTQNQIAVNLTSNLLGMGNASTPSGMNAISGLYRGSKYATSAMIMVIILNSTSLQLIPTTVIGLRVTAGSVSASDIILPTLIATIVSTVAGVLLVKVCGKLFKDK